MAEIAVLSMAATFEATRVVPKSAEELKKARETRAAEALRMKEEQLRILSDQNASLLSTLDKVSWTSNGYFKFDNYESTNSGAIQARVSSLVSLQYLIPGRRGVKSDSDREVEDRAGEQKHSRS